MLSKSGTESIATRTDFFQPRGLAGWMLERLRAYSAQDSIQREMRLVETLALGGRRQLMLVECGGERFLVGCGTDSVETIIRFSAGSEATRKPNGPGEQL